MVKAEVFVKEYDFDGPDMYRAEFEAFADAVLQNADPPCSGRDGLHRQHLLDVIYTSARSAKKIAL